MVPLARIVSRETADKVARELGVPQSRTGTVTSYVSDTNLAAGVATVAFDENTAGTPDVQVTNSLPVGLRPGDRVVVTFDPPAGAAVTGYAAPPIAPALQRLVFSYSGTPTLVESPPDEIIDGGTMLLWTALLGTAGSTSTVIDVLVSGVTVATLTLAAAATRTTTGAIAIPVGPGGIDTVSLLPTAIGTGALDLTCAGYYQ